MDERAVLAACRNYKLVRAPRRARGLLGDDRGARTGASLEFHSYRTYSPGDDPRRIDWGVYGRTGDLHVKLYAEEVRPHVDVLLDASRSMVLSDGRKAERPRELAAFAWHSARFAGNAARLHTFGEVPRTCESPADLARGASHERGSILFEQPARAARGLRPGGIRIVISDFMTPSGARAAIRELAATAAQLVVVMTLGPWEANPTPEGAARLTDSETDAHWLTDLSEPVVQRYLQRLARLREDVRSSCAAFGATFAPVLCDVELEPALRRDLLPARVVSPV
jgi:uncharacterized protein (DUF58 family)